MDQPLHIFVVNKRTYLMQRYTWSTATKQHEPRNRMLVCLGMPEYPTPSAVFTIKGHAKNPDWQMPYSDWVPKELQGTIIPGGDPRNPLTGAFMDFGFLGIGIHGTANEASLGTRASHGCIRVKTEQAIKIAELDRITGSKVIVL